MRNQSELAINGHDVQRRIEGVCERFAVSNYQDYSESLREWRDSITSHPLIASSDETDIHWIVIQLLLDVARNPVEAMTNRVIANNGKLIEFPAALDVAETSTHNALIESLLDLEEEIADHNSVSDELSDWSDEENESESCMGLSENKCISLPSGPHRPVRLPLDIRPPEKEPHFTELKVDDSEAWFSKTTQNSWWCEDRTKTTVTSKFPFANFAQQWNQFLDTLSMGFIADKNLSTTSEYILMREIIWMFTTPAGNCKFFRVDGGSVHLNDNVTTTSCSLPIIQSFLRSIINSMSHFLTLRLFARSLSDVPVTGDHPLPVVYGIYGACLLEHIQALERHLFEVEMKLLEQNDAMTSLTFIGDLEENHLKVIDALYRIHTDVVLEWRDKDNYLSSTYLFSRLWARLECPMDPMENNLVVSILLPCLQAYLSVFDSWWSLGCLHDYTDEFLITEWGDEREFPAEWRSSITKCPLIEFMVSHCRESHIVLTHLASLNRSSILSELIVERTSYQEFLVDFLKPFRIPPRHTEETQTESPPPTNEYYCELMELLQLEEQVRMESRKEPNEILTSRELFELFQGSFTNFNLPFLDLCLKSLANVLSPRIEAMHKKVATIFLEEFQIVNHFRNVNWVLLLESPAMYDFYTDLFAEIEADYNNLSPYQLTAKLDACLHAVHPKMESLFTVEVDRHYYKTELDTILDCLTKLRIEYNFQAGEGVIDFNTTPIYNKTFSFLLQIKWALWLLENLKFGDHLVRMKFFKAPNVLDFSIRRMGILRFWLLSSIKNVHSYLMHDVIECETMKLAKSLARCTSIAKIQKCHERFLDIIEEKCFLQKAQKDLQSVLQELLHFILIFRDYWLQLQAISDRDYQLEQKESVKILLDIKTDQLEGTYSNIHRCLIDRLQVESEGHSDGHGEHTANGH